MTGSGGATREHGVLASVRVHVPFSPLALPSRKLRVTFGAMFGHQQDKFQVDLERDGAGRDLGWEARNRLVN